MPLTRTVTDDKSWVRKVPGFDSCLHNCMKTSFLISQIIFCSISFIINETASAHFQLHHHVDCYLQSLFLIFSRNTIFA